MDCGKLWKIILDAVALILVVITIIIIVAVCSSCGKEEKPMQYINRMQFAGWSYAESPSKKVGVWIDKETGVCYCGANGKLTMMVDHDGKPFVANGWRDYNE